MTTYANATKTTPQQTRVEIESALKRYGCDGFIYAWDGQENLNSLTFRLSGRSVRLYVPMPDPTDKQFAYKTQANASSSRTVKRTEKERQSAYEQAERQRWRGMYLYVKAILEAIENNLTTIDQALMSSVLLPNGQTIGQFYGPQIEHLVLEGRMPPLLPGGK